MEASEARRELEEDPGDVSVKELKQNWQKWSSKHQEYQKRNPFSGGDALDPGLRPGRDDYGLPARGSQTERRGLEAHSRVSREVRELCDVIREVGQRRADGGTSVEFGTLFERYVTISNKLVGVLLRARRQGLLHFEGEMLWQGRDDRVLISLL